MRDTLFAKKDNLVVINLHVMFLRLRPSSSSILSSPSLQLMSAATRATVPPHSPAVTAGIIIIGDEILKGQTLDTNTSFLAGKLHSLGIRLERVVVLPDQVETVAEEVKSFSKRFCVVLTSGGIGPTHDDLTYEAVALAFQDRVQLNPYLEAFVESWFKTTDRSQPAFKLATVPSRAHLNFPVDAVTGKRGKFPIVSVENVYVFPGIPDLLKKGFIGLVPGIFSKLSKDQFHVEEIFINHPETSITQRLNTLVARYPGIAFGSYPELYNNYYKTKLTLESRDNELLTAALQDLKTKIPEAPAFDKQPFVSMMDKLRELIQNAGDDSFRNVLKESVDTLNECFEKYSHDEITLCFNGGKDCIVTCHLVTAIFQEKFPGKKLLNLYVREGDPFPEIETFINRSIESYNLDNMTIEGSMKSSLKDMMEKRPQVKATILGMRKGDPGGNTQDFFSPTDGDWPRVMRVNPILNWEYSHVWKFLRELSVPYPILYDQGYTSLGGVNNTMKNPELKFVDQNGKESYKPAYELADAKHERAGRIKKSKC